MQLPDPNRLPTKMLCNLKCQAIYQVKVNKKNTSKIPMITLKFCIKIQLHNANASIVTFHHVNNGLCLNTVNSYFIYEENIKIFII